MRGKLQKPSEADHTVTGIRGWEAQVEMHCFPAWRPPTNSSRVKLLTHSKISISEICFVILLMLPWPMEVTKLNTKQPDPDGGFPANALSKGKGRLLICLVSVHFPSQIQVLRYFYVCPWGPMIARVSPPTTQPRWFCAGADLSGELAVVKMAAHPSQLLQAVSIAFNLTCNFPWEVCKSHKQNPNAI